MEQSFPLFLEASKEIRGLIWDLKSDHRCRQLISSLHGPASSPLLSCSFTWPDGVTANRRDISENKFDEYITKFG